MKRVLVSDTTCKSECSLAKCIYTYISIRVFHDKHIIYFHLNVVESFVIQWEMMKND